MCCRSGIAGDGEWSEVDYPTWMDGWMDGWIGEWILDSMSSLS